MATQQNVLRFGQIALYSRRWTASEHVNGAENHFCRSDSGRFGAVGSVPSAPTTRLPSKRGDTTELGSNRRPSRTARRAWSSRHQTWRRRSQPKQSRSAGTQSRCEIGVASCPRRIARQLRHQGTAKSQPNHNRPQSQRGGSSDDGSARPLPLPVSPFRRLLGPLDRLRCFIRHMRFALPGQNVAYMVLPDAKQRRDLPRSLALRPKSTNRPNIVISQLPQPPPKPMRLSTSPLLYAVHHVQLRRSQSQMSRIATSRLVTGVHHHIVRR